MRLGPELQIAGSTASTKRVLTLLGRLKIDIDQSRKIPCCCEEAQLPRLSSPLPNPVYEWERGEASTTEIGKGRAFLQTYVCPLGVTVFAVQSRSLLEVHFPDQDARITPSKFDFIFMRDTEAVRHLPKFPTEPTVAQLKEVLGDILGAYETKTTQAITVKGIYNIWPQAMVQVCTLLGRAR